MRQSTKQLLILAAICGALIALAIIFLSTDEASASELNEAEQDFIEWCHSSQENLDYCEWYIWMQEPENRQYFEHQQQARTRSVWDDLADCESGDGNPGSGTARWHINTGNGYYGGIQFHINSWRSVGGTGYPHQHSRETQIEMGERLKARQGWGAWPACSRKMGLR